MERIVLVEDGRPEDTRRTDSPKNQQESEDENEIDLRERLLREKAIKSMQKRRLSHPNDAKMKSVAERIVDRT